MQRNFLFEEPRERNRSPVKVFDRIVAFNLLSTAVYPVLALVCSIWLAGFPTVCLFNSIHVILYFSPIYENENAMVF